MTNPYRAMCAELVRRWDAANGDHDLLGVADAMDRARLLLAQPEPEGLTDEELLHIWRFNFYKTNQTRFLDIARAAIAADRAQRSNSQGILDSSPQPPADGETAELAAELRHFIAGYQQMRGLDPEHVYSIHRGDAMEAHLRISRLSRIAELLERLASDNAGLEAAAESAYLDNLSLLDNQND